MNKLDTRSVNLNWLTRLRRLLLQYIIIFVFWRILEANNEEQINTRAYTKNISSNCLFHHLTSSYITWPILAKIRLCMKVGRGLRDTCAWGLHQDIFTRKVTDIAFTSDFCNNYSHPASPTSLCLTSPRPRPTRPRVPYLMSSIPSSRVPKSQVPTHASRCSRPLVPVPLLYTAQLSCFLFRRYNQKFTLRAVVSPGRTLRFDGKETTASNRLLFHRACASTWWLRISNDKTAKRTSTKQ